MCAFGSFGKLRSVFEVDSTIRSEFLGFDANTRLRKVLYENWFEHLEKASGSIWYDLESFPIKIQQVPYYHPLVSKWRPRFQKSQTCSRHVKNVFACISARFGKFDLDPVTLTLKVKVKVTLPPETFQTKKRSSTYPIPLRRYKHLKFSIHKLIDIVGGASDLAIFSCRNCTIERGANFDDTIAEES